MIYGVGLTSFVRKMRAALKRSDRRARRLNRVQNSTAIQQRMEYLEDRCVPATFNWTGGGILFDGDTPVWDDVVQDVPDVIQDWQLIGSNGLKGSYNWSDPRNWSGGVAPSGTGHDLVFDEAFTSFGALHGSFFGINDSLTSVRSITFVSGAATQYMDSFRMKGNPLKIEVQAGIRVFGPPGYENVLNINLTNDNSVSGFNITMGILPGPPPVDGVSFSMKTLVGSLPPLQAFGDAAIGNVIFRQVPAGGLNTNPLDDLYLPFDGDPLTVQGNINMQDTTPNVGGVLIVDVQDAVTTLPQNAITLNGAITGAGTGDGSRLFKTGPLTLTLTSSSNSYNGLTTINEGTIVLVPDAKLGNATGDTLIKSNATLLLTASFVDLFGVQHFASIPGQPLTNPTDPTLNEDLYLEEASNLLGQNNAFVDGRIFLLGSPNIGVADSLITRVQFSLNGQITDGNALSNNLNFNTGSDIDSVIILTNVNNNYRGQTIIGGLDSLRLTPTNGFGDNPFQLGSTGVIPNTSAVIVQAGARLDLNDFHENIGSLTGDGDVTLGFGRLYVGADNTSTTFGGRITSALIVNPFATPFQGGITKQGTGSLTLTNIHTYTGQTFIEAGTLRIGSALGVLEDNNVVTVNNLATFDLNSFSETIGSITGLGGSASLTLGSGILTTGGNNLSTDFDGVISGNDGGITKRGSGIFGLLGANTYTGPTNVLQGTLQLKNLSERLSDVTAVAVEPGAFFDLNNQNETIGSLSGSWNSGNVFGTVKLGSGTLTTGFNNQSTTFRGKITGTGGLVKIGTGVFALLNLNDYTGSTTVLAGTLAIGDANNPFGIVGSLTSAVTAKTGATLAGDGTITGNVSIEGGATFAPSNPLIPDALTINGNMTLLPDAIFLVTIADQTLYSRVAVNGAVDLGLGTAFLQFAISPVYVSEEQGNINQSHSFVLIDNNLTEAVAGYFQGGTPVHALPTASYIYVGTNLFRITYDIEKNTGVPGTAGNDVVLKSLINHAPVLDTAGNPTLPKLYEDLGSVAATVASIVGSSITDADSAFAVQGIAVVATGGTVAGTWQYSIDNGGTWTDFPTVAPTSALLLRANDLVRFVPAQDANGLGTIDYRAWDQTSGLYGNTIDLTVTGTGGSTAFSTATETATVTVVPINDAPVNNLPPGPYNTTEDVAITIAGVTVTDVDAAGNVISVMFTVTNGTLSVDPFAAGGVPAANIFGNFTGNLTLVGTVAQINATLAAATGLRYLNTLNFSGTDTLTMLTNDNGNSGNDPNSVDAPSPSLQDFDTRDIVIGPVNDAPILDGSALVNLTSIPEDTTNPAGDLISSFADPLITDPDVGALKGIVIYGTAQVTAGDTGPLTGTWQYYNGSTWTNFGAVSATNALLLPDGYTVRFVPDANKNGKVSFLFRAWDRTSGTIGGRVNLTTSGTGGSTAFSAATNTAFLTVASVIDGPVITLPGGDINYIENSGLSILDVAATITDNDSTNFNGGVLTISFAANGTTDDRLVIQSVGNLPGQIFLQGSTIRYSGTIIGTFGGGTGGSPLTITFTTTAATPTAVQALLRSIAFRNDSDFPNTAARSIQFQMTDGGGGISVPVFKTVNIVAINDAPTLTVPANQFVTVENSFVYLTGISVADLDAGSNNIAVTLVAPNGFITIATNVAGGITAGQVSTNGTGTVLITAPLAAINATFASATGVKYSGNLYFNGEETVTVIANDLGNSGAPGPLTDTKTITVVVGAVNTPPVNTLPAGPLQALEDVELLITGVSVADVDAGNGPIIVSFTVNHGVLFFTTNVAGGVPASQINGNGTNSVTLAYGTMAQVNATLAVGFKYIGRTQVDLTDVLSMTTNDLGSTGTGGQLTDTDTVNIVVKAVNDAPVNVMPSQIDAFTNTDTAINSIYSNDPDALDFAISVQLSALHATLRVNTAAATGVTVTGNGTSLLNFTGTQSKINTILATLVYRSTVNYIGADTLTMTTNDNGNSGIGSPMSATSSAAVNVKARTISAPGQGVPKPDVIGRLNGQWWMADSDGTQFKNYYFGSWATTIQWVDVQVGDITGDGVDDVFGRDAATGVWWAGLTTATGFTNKAWGAWSTVQWNDIRIADINGDGLVDVIGREATTGNWWGGISTGIGFNNVYLGTWTPAIQWADVLVLDLDGNGKSDIVGRDPASGIWYAGVSNGGGFQNRAWGAWASSVQWTDVEAGDINGDGIGDVFGRDKINGQWWAAISNGGSFINQYLGQWTPSINWIDVLATDLNGDDKTDVVGRDSANGQWWAGTSNGSSFVMSLYGAWSAGAPWVDVQTADVNSDGKLDIVGRLYNTGDWWVAQSNGSTFTNKYFGKWAANQPWVDVKAGNFSALIPSSRPIGQSTNSNSGSTATVGASNVVDTAVAGTTGTAAARSASVATTSTGTSSRPNANASYLAAKALQSGRIDLAMSRAHATPKAAVDLFGIFDDVI